MYMLSDKTRIYNKSCKWLDGCINVFLAAGNGGKPIALYLGFFLRLMDVASFFDPERLKFYYPPNL